MDSARFRACILWIGATLSVLLLTETGVLSHSTFATMSGGGMAVLVPLYFMAR